MEKRILIQRWLGADTQPIPIYDEASVSSARQRVRETGQRLNLGTNVVEYAALIASELTHNQLTHAKQGYFAVKGIERQRIPGLELVAADLGPGIEKPREAIVGGITTERSLGAGLASVCRIADEVEFDNRISEGTCIVARKFEGQFIPLCGDVSIMGRPYPHEAISGDDAVWFQSESGFLAAVADGLGHGPEARAASNQAITLLAEKREQDLVRILTELDAALAATRGCAISIVRFNQADRIAESVSLGDVRAHLYHRKEAEFFAATPMVVGGRFPANRIRVERAAVEPGSVLVMFTDGLKTRTSLKGQLDILRRPPIAIAQHLLENYSRPDDDALVLVARFRS